MSESRGPIKLKFTNISFCDWNSWSGMGSEAEENTVLQAITGMEGRLNTRFDGLESRLDRRLDHVEEKVDTVVEDVGFLQEKVGSLERSQVANLELINKLLDRAIKAEAHGRRLNLRFHGITYSEDENVVHVLNNFLIQKLGLNADWVSKLLFRDVHRLPEYKGGRDIICGFVSQFDRNEVYKRANKLKNTDFVIKVDLPAEWAKLQNDLLLIRKTIRRENPEALAVLTYKAYKPVLLVKHRGKVQQYDSAMTIEQLQPGDREH